MRKISHTKAATRGPISAGGLALHAFTFDAAACDANGRLTKRQAHARQLIETLGDGVTLEMVHIPGGVFTMGAPQDEPGSGGEERPQHKVSMPPFYLGKSTVTIAQWRAVMGAIPGVPNVFRADPRQPVVRVSCEDAEAFCARLSERCGRRYRLPSEAEWEYACRAGTTTPFCFGSTIAPAIVNSREAGRGTTVAAGSLGVANDFGLFDMHGNVWEWCRDLWHGDYRGAPADGSAWLSDSDARSRVLRGGAWSHAANSCRAAARIVCGNTTARSRKIGFRVAMTGEPA
jgi:formylglycine-generating enzyme required for sulfatase activity